MSSARFTDAELTEIDRLHRAGETVRCPCDGKPLVTSRWTTPTTEMVYFLCRACTRLGAVAYDVVHPESAPKFARASRPSRPPPRPR